AADGSGGGERSGAGLVAGSADTQMRVRTIAPAASLDDQLLTSVHEQLQFVIQHVRVETRQALPVAQRDPRDDERVSLVMLAARAAAAATVTGEHSRHVNELLAGNQQPPDERESVAASVLDRDQPRPLKPCKPPAELLETCRAGRHLQGVEQPSLLVDRGGRVRARVRVDSDDDHSLLLDRSLTIWRGVSDRPTVRFPRPYQVTRRPSRSRGDWPQQSQSTQARQEDSESPMAPDPVETTASQTRKTRRKMARTSVRRRISLFSLSRELLLQSWRQCSFGKPVKASRSTAASSSSDAASGKRAWSCSTMRRCCSCTVTASGCAKIVRTIVATNDWA